LLLVNRSKTAEYVTDAVDDAAIAAQVLADDALQWWHRPPEDRVRPTAKDRATRRAILQRRHASDTRITGKVDDDDGSGNFGRRGSPGVGGTRTSGPAPSKQQSSSNDYIFEKDRNASAAAEILRRNESELPLVAFTYARRP